MIVYKVLLGLPSLRNILAPCKTCLHNKYSGKKLLKALQRRATQIPQLVHLCKPFKVKSLSGMLHYITFIDDFLLRLTKVRFLPSSKSSRLKQKNIISNKIQKLPCNNGVDYVSKALKTFCKELAFTVNLHKLTARTKTTLLNNKIV